MSQNRLGRALDLLDEVSAVLIDDEDDQLYDLVEDHLAQARILIRDRLLILQRLLLNQWTEPVEVLTDG